MISREKRDGDFHALHDAYGRLGGRGPRAARAGLLMQEEKKLRCKL
jgi:hypothetical protein